MHDARGAFILMTVVFVAVLAAMGFFINQNQQLAQQGREAKLGVCSYRADLGARIGVTADSLRNAKQYLRDHPDGAPGISVALIRLSIKNQTTQLAGQKAAYSALAVMHCPDP